ncbi:MAG: insulinase family protein [Clostridiales bacterium]|nr:insulinase family protein [Clostridiales bacterium]
MAFSFENGSRIHGFRVVSAAKRDEPEGTAVRMEHEKTGAQLFWLDNGEENMVFSITFRTLPEDSTGVFHILEHSVLCGSRLYPVKEPFVELLKSSMSTFLNAMTFPDMTMYPVSSRNPRDLMNLTRVYLDAVFAPVVMTDRKRFCQEGWHIDRDEDGNPEYRGVVFNEMKGSMSDVDTLIDRQVMKQLFPDTSYGFNSGGDPECIPDLSYEQFRSAYRRHYHPSNARIYLDGAVPIWEMLPLLDSYLSAYERTDRVPEFSAQVPKASEETIEYELAQEESPENRGYLTMARITGTWRDRAENLARGIVCDVLTGSNEAPLKRAALERGLAQDLSLSVDDTGYQSWIAVHAENVTDGKEAEIRALLEETGRAIERDGLDRGAAEASLNRLIYNLREDEEPRGIGRCIRCMGQWLYGGDPAEALETQGMIRDLKEMLDNGRLDALAADMLLNREGMAVLHTRPSHIVGTRKREAEAERIRRTLAGWSEEEKAENDRLIDELAAWQQAPDPEEELKKLPTLTRADADRMPEWTETEKRTVSGVPVMIHRIPCNGVVHLRAYFSMADYSLEELTKAALFAGMMGRLPTGKHDALSLQQEIKRYTGSLGFAIVPRTREGEGGRCTPYLTAFVSALEENRDKAEELLLEILTDTRPEGQEDRIREMMMQNELGVRQRIVSAGHTIAVKHVMSLYSPEGAVKNALDGDAAVRYIHAFAADPAGGMPGLMDTARKMLRETVCRRRMLTSVTGNAAEAPETLISALPEGNEAPTGPDYRNGETEARGYLIPAQTGFAARGYRLDRCGMKYHGSMWLAAAILSLGYLWNRVRVQGGAYGAGFQIDRSGNMFSYSFRDPTPGKTLAADAGAAEYLRAFAENGENLDSYIISSLNELNPLLSPRDKGALADAREMTGYTREDAERIRKEILNATAEDLVRCCEWLEKFAGEGSVCVVAHRDALSACEGLDIREL